MLVFALVASAAALELNVGAQLALSKDLPDLGAADPPAELGFAPTLIVPARLSPWPEGPWLRAELGLQSAMGWGRVSEDPTLDAPAEGVQQDMRSTSAWLALGPELHVPMPAGSPVIPYFGASVGGALVGSRVNLDGSLSAGDAAPVTTRQLRPRVGAQLGLELRVLESVALGVEAGYSVCRIPERAISGREDLQRDAYGLNPYSLGVSFSMPL
ncbi:MAG: hypothetical protein H6741_11070 [Alphaproteobacteria bacterium]|nr:hypothetical protein [Alphaproteobacteria bacterium]